MEMQTAIKKMDPRKRVEVSGFHMNQVAKSVQLIRSETYLTELMETICKYYKFPYLHHIPSTLKIDRIEVIIDFW